jgi:hypothetical protein
MKSQSQRAILLGYAGGRGGAGEGIGFSGPLVGEIAPEIELCAIFAISLPISFYDI